LITPNKFTSLDQSILAKLELVLRELSHEQDIRALYRAVGSQFETVHEFILALDVLHILRKVHVNLSAETVTHVD
jgi:hypothetical protein